MSFIRQQSIQSAHAGRYSKLEIIAQQKQPRLQDHLWGGWRTTVLTGAVMTFIILIANFVILVWASVRRQGGNDNGAGAVTLYTGTCTEMGKVFTWSHLGVNVLSTILLSAGTACMQCLSSPTRQEINEAHSQGSWLDIGIPSMRNLRWISGRRQLLWVLLAISSLPLHLLLGAHLDILLGLS
jgi:hypothetical protein